MQSAMRTLVLDRATAEVVDAWRRADVPSVLLKGPAITRWLYRDAEFRGYADIDLLVPDREVGRAEEVLRTLGFERHGLETIEGDWPRYSRAWIRSESTINVDLHTTLAGVGVEPDRLWDVLTEDLERLSVAGLDVDVLPEAARALVLALHTAKDGSRIAKARHDLGHAIDRLPRDLWPQTRRLAERLDAVGGLAAGLRLVVPSGAALADELGLPTDAPLGVAIRLHGGAPPLALGIDWLVTTPGVRGKVRLVIRKIFPPATYLRAWTPIASRGPLGLVVAYAYRAAWVVWHVPPAVWAWARTRRRSNARETGGHPHP
jgi:hypothetical protein